MKAWRQATPPLSDGSSCRGSIGKQSRPHPVNRHASSRPQAVRARSATHLPLSFAWQPSPSAPWARGLLSAFWEWGSPDLPACGPWRGCASRPVQPIFINKAFETLARGQASRGGRHKTSSGAASPGYLARSGDIKAGQTSRGSHDVSHDDQDQAGASAQCPCFPFGAKEASAGAEYRGIRQRFPYRCNETKTSRTAGGRSPWSPRRRHR